MTHWINKKGFNAAGIVAGGLALFFWLFFDNLLRAALVSAGQAAAGAKVEIASLKTKVLSGRLEIKGIAVADKGEPMKNLFELESAAFQFSPAQALRAKAVLPESSLLGFRFGTPRKTSGALPLTAPSKLERLIAEQLAPVKENLSGEVKDLKADLDPKKLESLKSLDAAQDKLGQVGDDLKKKVGVENVEARIKEIEAQIKQIQGGGSSPADILRKTQLVTDTQKKIKDLIAEVDKSRAVVNSEIGGVQAKLKQAQDLRNKDVNGLLQAAGLPAIDAESVTKRLLGPEASRKLSKVMYWIAMAKKRSAAQGAKVPPPAARRRGVDVEFPRSKSYPQFLLEQGKLSGRVGEMDLSGTVTGVNSNPALYGKPTRLHLEGPKLKIDGSLDPRAAELSFQYAGLALAGTQLGDEGLGASLTKGSGRVNGTIRVVGEQWNGTVQLQADGVGLEPKTNMGGQAGAFAAKALSSIGKFTATVGISGTEDDLRFKISSDLGQSVAEGMKKAFSGELAKQRQALEAKVDALYAGRAKELQGRTDALQKQLLAPLDKQKAALEDQLKRAVSKGLGGIKLWR